MTKIEQQMRCRFELIFLGAAEAALLKKRRQIAKKLANDLAEYMTSAEEFFDKYFEGLNDVAITAGNAAVRKERLLDNGDLPGYIEAERLEEKIRLLVKRIFDDPMILAVQFYKERILSGRRAVEQVLRSKHPRLLRVHFDNPSMVADPIDRGGLDIV